MNLTSRKKLIDIKMDLRNRGKIGPSREMSEEEVVAFCVEVVHAAMAKRLRSDIATNRAGGGEDRAAAEKIRKQLGNSEEEVALYGGPQNGTAANRAVKRLLSDTEKINNAFGSTEAEQRLILEGPSDFEAQVVQDVLRASASEARMRSSAIGREPTLP